ncbi:MAG: prepilin-type N-terminal cleavage/methylation domain-containing protein [Acidobacteria bacterium]|nr:prepilin-type N-terminal cleavage/methylation domain-containing protein [Acidobacteriota bacterium]
MKRARGGFTLLEVLVATTIMAIAVGTILAALSASVRNAGRLVDSDRAAVLARRTMDALLTTPIPHGQVIEGRFELSEAGMPSGWRARVELFETVPGQPPAKVGIERLLVEIWWTRGSGRRTMTVEGYRQVLGALP